MKEGLIYISDRLGQLRYSDGNANNRWLQPLSSYKALKTIKRGQAVSVATEAEIKSVLTEEQYATYESDPSPYIVPTNTKIHNRCIGLALEYAELDGEVHILSSGQFEYDKTKDSQKEYDPKFTTKEISKKVYVSNKEGELTTSSEVAYEHYNNIIQIGHIIDASAGTNQKTILEVQIQGDDRGVLESTQFEAVLGEDVYISKDEPLTVFAFGQEEASKFKLKLCTRNMEGQFTEEQLKASFIVIKKLSGEYSLIKFSNDEIHTDDTTDLSTLGLLKSRYTPKKGDYTIEEIDFTNSSSSIKIIIKALKEAIKEMGDDLDFEETESSTSDDNKYSNAVLELNENGGYYDIYYSNSLKDFLRDTTTLQNGSLFNKNRVVLADIRVDARKNVFGVLVNKSTDDIKLKKDDRILLMRQGELVVNSKDLTAIGKRFVLGENGSVVCEDDALRTADSTNTIGYLKKLHNDHYHFVIDIGENIPKVEYSTYPVGYLKPYFGSTEKGKETPDFGYLLTGKTYPIVDYKELYERLLGWYDEKDIYVDDYNFKIPEIKDKAETIMQIKYVTDGIFERLPKVPYLRDFGSISETAEHTCGINDLDITALLSINTTFSEVDTLPLENLDIHLYIDPDYTEGEHNWREVRPGFYKYNNVDTYGFEWKIKKSDASEDHIYGKYILSADIGESRGIYYTSSKNVAPISCDKVPYKLYVAVKQTNIEHFDLRNLMSNYISNTIYNGNNEVDDIYAVTGEAVVKAIRNNKLFNVLKNEKEESIVDFGGTKKLNTEVNIQTNKAIKLNCTITSDDNSVLIGETKDTKNDTKNVTLEIKDGKAFLNKLNKDLFAIKEGESDFVNADNEVATISDVLGHALASIDSNVSVKDTIINNDNFNEGRIHGMIFGKGGNIDASTLCSYNVNIAYGQDITDVPNAIIPIIYKTADGVHTPLQGSIDYYTFENEESKKLFTLRPSYEQTDERLDLTFQKDGNSINRISFGNATIVAETELPSLSRYKIIHEENLLRGPEQFTTSLDDGSKPAGDEKISFDFAYILQAAYELPMAYWKYRGSDEYNIGPIIERLQDTINYFENKENDITYTVDGDKDPYKYTPEQKSGIAKSLKDIIAESGKSVRVDDMVGFLLAAAGETQKRLAKLERSTYGRDVMEKEKINFENLDGVTPDHTYYGLNRLVRAICLELFGKADPDELKADEATLTSLSRMDAIERQIRGSRNTPDKDNGSITDNSINDFDNKSDSRYSISSSYPYEENIEANRDNIINEDIYGVSDNTIINTKETIFGTENANDPDSFNGVVDAIYRITQKVDVLTEAINGTNDILQPHTTLNKIKRNIETLIQELYFDGANGENAYKDTLGQGDLFDGEQPSRVDEITKELYNRELEYINYGDTQDETKSEILAKYEGASYDSGNKKLTISSPENIAGYENISIIDIILKAIGNQILLKHYSTQDGSIIDRRFNNDISKRLYDIEQCLDKIVLKLKDNNNFEAFVSTDDSTTILNLDDFTKALSKLLGYTPVKDSTTENDKFISSSGVVPGAEDNSNKYSAEYALRTKSNIVAGLENLLYRVQNEEKDNLHVRSVLGDELMKGVTVSTAETGNKEQDTQKPSVTESFTLSDDIKDLLATIYGEVQSNPPDSNKKPAGDYTYYKHRTIAHGSGNNGNFLSGDNIIENIVNELYYIPKPLNSGFNYANKEEDAKYYVTDSTLSVNKKDYFGNNSLIAGEERAKNFRSFSEEGIPTGGRKSRLDILESDVRALRKFIGLAGILSSTNGDAVAKEAAINGTFSFSKNNDSDDNNGYWIKGSMYQIGASSNPLETSFIEAFFELMTRFDIVEYLCNSNKDDLDNKFNKSNIIGLDDETSANEKSVYSTEKVDSIISKLDEAIGTANGTVSSLNESISKANGNIEELTSSIETAQAKLNNFKVSATNLISSKAEDILTGFTVTGTKNLCIKAPDNKTYYCKVSFILDPNCEIIGNNTSKISDDDGAPTFKNKRKSNINSAIKYISPSQFAEFEESPSWTSIEDASKDTRAHVVFNRYFSNMFTSYIDSNIDMESKNGSDKGIYCGISSTEYIKKVGCIMSDLILVDKDSNKGTQYSPFYFELEFVPKASSPSNGDWYFSWALPTSSTT